MTIQEFLKKYNVKCLYHFTDTRNLTLISAGRADGRGGAAGCGGAAGAAEAAGGDRECRGGGRNIGADRAAKSPADGYTLYLGNNATVGLNTLFYKQLTLDPLKDLAPVTMLAESQTLLVVHPTVPELVTSPAPPEAEWP